MNNYTIPEVIEMDYNFGYLIGAYAAEGCMTKFQLSIANNDAEYFKPILALCEKWNITTKIYRHENKCHEGWTSQDLRIYNTLLCRILEKFCGKLSHNKFVSDKIVFSNRECLLGFMDAYIGGDGTVDKKGKGIHMASVSKQLLIDVQQILNILGVYSFIQKPKKQEKNNRGTLPENIHQMYHLFVRNGQAKKLALMLNINLAYKQENLSLILNHTCKYEIHKKDTIIPNEIDGEIVFEERNNNYLGVLFDKIKSIEEVPNTTNYAYDLTISDTRNFNIYNGLCQKDTFHMAGVSTKSNVTTGVPRIEEILTLTSEPKNPSLNIYLKPEDETDKDKAHSITYMLEHTKLKELVRTIEICFDPNDYDTLIKEDRETIAQFKAFEQLAQDCGATSSDETEKSKWIIRMVMDAETMLEKNITMDDLNFTLNNCYENQLNCIYSDYNSEKLVFRIRMNEVIKSSVSKTKMGEKVKTKVKPLDQSDHIYMLKNFQDQLLENVVIRGISGIRKVNLRKVKDNVVEHNGSYKKQDIWVLDTIGTNLMEILSLDFIDKNRTVSNNIVEVYDVLGIEAARQTIYNEFVEVIEHDGTYINYHNFSILCDRMTFTSRLISICRHGINNDDIGPIAKASFEETPEMFLKAARHSELDTMRGVSANIMCGQEGFFGTSCFQVILDLKEMEKLTLTTMPPPSENEEEFIDKFFEDTNVNDPCDIGRLEIRNNVMNIKSKNMMGGGNEDADYQPGF
jgi:DNA-directed RNA polymerase beta' subunit